MDDLKTNNEKVFYKDVTDDGKTVTVVTRWMDESLWELSIHGNHGQFTTWTEWFSSSDTAMGVGMSAILKEGIQTFYSDPEFDYLY